MPELTSLFPDVADALDIESVAIVEKDYFVVDLLRLLKEIKPETHTLVFAGGTALSKAGISLNRMSEDIDIKLVPTENFMQNGRDKRRKIRKEIGNDSNLLIVFYVQIMPDDFVMQLHRF